MARKPLPIKSAHYTLGFWVLLSTVATFVAVGAFGSFQRLCHDDSMAPYWTPQYNAFMQSGMKPFTCTWFLIAYWWAIANQLGFLLGLCFGWARGELGRFLGANMAGGAVASATCIIVAIFELDARGYYTGDASKYSKIGFWGLWCVSFINIFVLLSICDLDYSLKHAASSLPLSHSRSSTVSDGSDATNGGSSLKDRRLTTESV